MRGMDATSGQPLEGLDHLRQSIRDVLLTPRGSRICRREYGSRLWELVDAPVSPAWLADVYAAVAEALDRWEPRIRVSRVSVTSVEGGNVVIGLEGSYLPDGRELTLGGIVL